jgi:hypothetical protein
MSTKEEPDVRTKPPRNVQPPLSAREYILVAAKTELEEFICQLGDSTTKNETDGSSKIYIKTSYTNLKQKWAQYEASCSDYIDGLHKNGASLELATQQQIYDKLFHKTNNYMKMFKDSYVKFNTSSRASCSSFLSCTSETKIYKY